LGLAGAFLALVGLWTSWVPHRAAALSLSGWDLAEFIRFVPGAMIPHELFFLPACCAGITLALIAANFPIRSTRLTTKSLLSHFPIFLVALALMLAILPPYPDLFQGYRLAMWRWRYVMGAGGALLVLLSAFSGRWPARLVGGLLLALALAGSLPALWQFLQVRNELEAVYGSGLGWGWGLGVFLLGWGLVGISGGRSLFSRQASNA
jgi:hypothetical protein